MRVGIVMPVVLQEPSLLDCTREAVEAIRAACDACLYVICNRLHVCTKEELRSDLASRFGGEVVVVNDPGVSRSVAGAWNLGAELALGNGAEYVAFIANDTRLEPDCLDLLLEFGERGGADLWSGISYNHHSSVDPSRVTDGADFTCFMVRPSTLGRFGWFDPNFKPAYFEDNDYYARVVLGGGACRVVHAAQFFHHVSATIQRDAEAAHHVSSWFESNRAYFARKWGVTEPAGSSHEVLARYYRNPFNDSSRSVSWFPAE